MKTDCRLLALFILLTSVGATACDDSSGSITCGITDAICQNANKTLDAENCFCVRKKPASACILTEEICRSENKTLNAETCVCVSKTPDPACSLTEEICRSENKTLNAETCVCMSKTPEPACSLTEEICRSENKTLDEVNCVCLELLPEPLNCKEYEHVYGSGCEVDTTENCGSHGYNCSTAVYGWKSGTCTDGQCLVTECNDRLYLKEEGICTESLSHDDHIIFGHYEQDGDTANGKEPIVWRVLEMNAFSYFVISEKVLDVVPFHTSMNGEISWEKSTIRSWLNGYDGSDSFIDAAFTEAEKKVIEGFPVSSVPDPDYSSDKWVTTEDKIFLLAVDDLHDYLGYDSENKEKNIEYRLAEATPYALKKGVFTNINGAAAVAASQSGICPDTHCYAYWWLRSPGLFKYLRTVVWADGNVLEDGYIVEDEKVGVRPAMWIWLR